MHGGGGVVGLLSVPWFMYSGQYDIITMITTDCVTSGLEEGKRGIFWDGHTAHPWLVLGHQLLGMLAISAWSMAWSALVFGILK